MTGHRHTYDVTVVWTGNRGGGTTGYAAYGREHEVTSPAEASAGGPPVILGSSDPAFRGDPARWNPEQLLVAALSQCHLLWYLHLAAEAGVVVTAYEDHAHGVMTTDATGGGRFERVVLSPVVTIACAPESPGARSADALSDADALPAADALSAAMAVHHAAHQRCFVANSVNFPVEVDAEIRR